MNEKRLIGIIPVDNTIRLFLPQRDATERAALIAKARLAEWFNGAVTYRATATYTQDSSSVTEGMIVVETHATDHQFTAHRRDLEAMVTRLAALLEVPDIIVDINNREQPPTVEAPPQRVYSTEQAAEYLGVSVATVKHHVHNIGDLHGEKIGPALYFTQDELDRYKTTPRPTRGRPKK